MPDHLSTVESELEAHGQDHLVAALESLESAERESLRRQIEALDLEALDRLVETYVRTPPVPDVPADLLPAPYYHNDPAAPPAYDAAHYRQVGEDLVRAGRVAAFTVAGGQGTRLGWNGPKGTFPATVVTGKPLFRIFAEQILATEQKYGVAIPWYIMTSPMNDASTRAFFADNNHFGLNRGNIIMFPQGVMPSFDAKSGRLLLADRHSLAVSPDGHGGSIKALRASGAVEDMIARGVQHVSYFQVDNPLVRAIDPLFIGLHAAAPDSSGEMSSKMVPKVGPDEKVGVFCRSLGRTCVIEYSDLPDDLMNQRDDNGRLVFLAGSIAVHVLSVAFVEKLTADAHTFGLPYHRADKKVPYHDVDQGTIIEPTEPNAVKLEAFVFDAIPLAESSIVYETSRLEEFAPIKNATGVDSVETSHQLQSDRAGAWFEAAGVQVPRNHEGHVEARIEVSPLTALEATDLAAAPGLPTEIRADNDFVF